MALTIQNIVDRARVPLQDAAKVRFADAKLLVYANDAIYTLRNKRPDLFFGLFSTLPSELAIGATFPLPDDYAPAVQDYVTARGEAGGAEADMAGRAAAFFALFKAGAID